MGKYINPIPYIDQAERFEIRFSVELNELTDVRDAKEIVADYILSMDKQKLIDSLSCEIFPVYPKNCSV
ncbi:MAG: hypothetical protein NC548_39675 [Lachnospiraceae bacterium]|nr:hypothetical protein [Lachnospiraceae bacterium]